MVVFREEAAGNQFPNIINVLYLLILSALEFCSYVTSIVAPQLSLSSFYIRAHPLQPTASI